MANNKNLLKLYLIGMLATVIGFCCPMFKEFFGLSKPNGFSFIDFHNSGFLYIGAILIFFGALAGVIFSLINIKSLGIFKLLSVCAALVGIILFIIGYVGRLKAEYTLGGLLSNVVQINYFEEFINSALIGFYLVVAGTVLAAVGYATNK